MRVVKQERIGNATCEEMELSGSYLNRAVAASQEGRTGEGIREGTYIRPEVCVGLMGLPRHGDIHDITSYDLMVVLADKK